MIEEQPGRDWRDLQCRVADILHECGFVTETAKSITTARGKTEVDVFATDPLTTPESIYLCECKRWASAVPQGEVQTFRTVVDDAGANFGLFVSAQGFQAGAHEVVKHTNIRLLDWEAFQSLFLERWCSTLWVPTFRSKGHSLADYVDLLHSDAAPRFVSGELITPAEAVGLMASDMWAHPFTSLLPIMGARPMPSVSESIWQCRNRYLGFLPKRIAEANYLRDLLDALIAFSSSWLKQRES